MITLTNDAILEIANLSTQAEALARGSSSDRAQSTILVQRISSIRQTGISSDQMRGRYSGALLESLTGDRETRELRYKKAFKKYMRTGEQSELRDLLSGSATILYTQAFGAEVPIAFRKEITEGLAQTSPLFDPSVVDLIQEESFTTNPKTVSGWDLTAISSQQIAEGAITTPSSTPVVRGKNLNGWMFRTSLIASLEIEQDGDDVFTKLSRALGVGFGRGIGYAITNNPSSGIGAPQGIYPAAPSSGLTLGVSAGKVTATEIEALYFSINRIYRASPKFCFLCHDSVYQALRNSVDNSGRPLISIHNDTETLLGKRILITPDLPSINSSPLTSSVILAGDLSHFIVRLSAPWVQRSTQGVAGSNGLGSILAGESTFHGRMRVDSYLFDPSNGATPPIVSAVVNHQ